MSMFGKSIFSTAKAAIPTEYYDVREETTPKAGWVPMFAFTILVYTTAVVAFATLYSFEAKKSTVETTIMPYDNSGNDGYSCQMISRVTESYQYPAKTDPALAYGLVNIIETKAQCVSNFETGDPCSQPLTYFPGTYTARDTTGAAYRATALYGSELAFVMEESGLPVLYSYNYSTGAIVQDLYSLEYNYNDHDTFVVATNSIAVDRTGYPIFASSSEADTLKIIFRSSPAGSGVDNIAFSTDWYGEITLLNDNLYNVYMIQNNTFLALDVYSTPAVSTVLFALPVAQNIVYAAVYHDGTTPIVYYFTSNTVADDQLYKYTNGVSTLIDKDGVPDVVKGVLVDGNNNLYVPYQYFAYEEEGFGEYYVLKYVPDKQSFYEGVEAGTFTQLHTASYFSIDTAGTRILAVEKSVSNGAGQWAFLYIDPEQAPPVDYDDSYTVTRSVVVKVAAQFGAGFFACEGQVLNTTQYVPGATAEYPQACPSNGVVGKIVYNQPDTYMFTPTDAAAYAVSNSVSYCDALYAPVCATVSNLPPYSCSRTLHQGFFACAATAVANTQFLVQLLIFFTAMLLPKLTTWFPFEVSTAVGTEVKHHHHKQDQGQGQGQHVHSSKEGGSDGADIEMGAVGNSGSGNGGGSSGNMGDTVNPMRRL